ncbi:E3S [Bat mastadenovirus]|nr:E3S [Bat mastadenovirus]
MNGSNTSQTALIIQLEAPPNKFQHDLNNYLIASNVSQLVLYFLAAFFAILLFICQKHKLCQKFKELKKYNISLKLRQSIRTSETEKPPSYAPSLANTAV